MEFSVLDLFDALDSQLKKLYPDSKRKPHSKQAKAQATPFVRYSSWIDAHKFVVAAEEAEVLSLARTRTRLLAQAGMLGAQDASTGDLLEDDTVGSMEMSDEEESMDGNSVSDEEAEGSIVDDVADADESDNESDIESEGDDEQAEMEAAAAAEEAYIRQLQDEAFESELRK